MKLYEMLAEKLQLQVEQGILRTGEKIPSVRRTSLQHKLSITTVLRAYLLLESRGIIEGRPQSGYFVRTSAGQAKTCGLLESRSTEFRDMDSCALALSNLRFISDQQPVPLGSPYPNPSAFPSARISQISTNLARRRGHRNVMGDLPPGNPELIRQIARRHLETGMSVDPQEIVITDGATEAINLCLQVIGQPGDAVAVESPTYYALLNAVTRLNMRVVPIETDPKSGICLDALERAIVSDGIVACVVMPSFQNPTGFEMPDDKKRELVNLMSRYSLPIIENDVYGELHFSEQRRTPIKSYDKDGLVLYCSSFSKSLSAESRVGWTMAGRYREAIERHKFLNTFTPSSLPQMAIAEYLKNDGYDFHLRRLRKTYAQQARIMTAAVRRFFPLGTTTSIPTGGYLLWVTLPKTVNALTLYERARKLGISVAPGNMFATDARFSHCIRLNYSLPWDVETETAVKTLGRLAEELNSGGNTAPLLNDQLLVSHPMPSSAVEVQRLASKVM